MCWSPGTSSVVMVNSSPLSTVTGPLAKVARRIFGPCRSARMPIGRPVSSETWRTLWYRSSCSVWEPWLMFSRATFMPASTMAFSCS